MDALAGNGNRVYRGDRRGGRAGRTRGAQFGEQFEVDHGPFAPELHHDHVTVERCEVDQDSVDPVAQAAHGPAFLVVFEGLDLAAQPRRHGLPGLDAE